MSFLVPNEAELNILTYLIDTAGVDCHLYSNDLTPDQDTGLADVTECAFSGYASEPLTFGTAATDGSGVATNDSDPIRFQPDTTVSETAYGAYLTFNDGVDDKLCGIERFSTAVNFTGTGTVKDLQIQGRCRQEQ